MNEQITVRGPAKKSVLASAALSFFFGPIGWLYAAPMRSAVIGAVGWVLAWAILPKFIMLWIAGFVCPVSAIAGVVYALAFNKWGERVALFGKDAPPPRLP